MRLNQPLTRSAAAFVAAGSLCALLAGSASGAAAPPAGVNAAATNLLRNPGFETPVLPADSYRTYSPGEKYPGWTIVGPAGSNVNPVTGDYSDGGYTFDAQSGQQWMDVTGTTQSKNAGVSQTVATTPRANYTLTFWVGTVDAPGTQFGTSSTLAVKIDGTLDQTATNAKTTGGASQTWKQFTLTFRASTASTTVAFLNRDPSSDTDNGLDTVSLVKK